MTKHKTGTREDWLAARVQLLKAEKRGTNKATFYERGEPIPRAQ